MSKVKLDVVLLHATDQQHAIFDNTKVGLDGEIHLSYSVYVENNEILLNLNRIYFNRRVFLS